MSTTFTTNPFSLKTLLDGLNEGTIQLPDFQRSWVWDDERIRGVLASVSRAFPIGAVMMLQTGGEARFKTRPVQGVQEKDAKSPTQLILDGQQRLTSLFQAMLLGQVVETVNARKQHLRVWFYVDMMKALEATNEKEWQKIREDINRVDSSDSPYTAIVSVMMLKEGWDVRNVKVIVPLRPCDSRQLTEQLLGRGLRRMFPPAWTAEGERRDQGRAEGLYVIRHPSFERIIKNIADIIEDEPEDGKRPDPTRLLVKVVEPQEEREKRDLPISVIVGEPYDLTDDWIEKIGRGQMPPLPHKFPYVQDLKEIEGIIKHEGAAGADTIAEAPLKYNVQATGYASVDAVISAYSEAIRAELRMTGSYTPAIKGIVKAFLERCTFDLRGIPLSLEAAADYDEDTRQIVIDNIRRGPVKQQVIQSVAKIIGQARSGKETPDVQVSTRHAKDLSEYEASPTQNMMKNPAKSVHTLCCFDSGDELKFAQMLDEADDVVSWLWNDQTGVGFRIQYSFEGRMPYYYPDFLVRLTDGSLYIVESKGSIRERDRAKQSRAERYADILREATGEDWRYIFLVNDSSIGRMDMAWWRQQGRTMFRDLVKYTQNAATGAGLF